MARGGGCCRRSHACSYHHAQQLLVNAPVTNFTQCTQDLSNSCGVAGRPFKHHDSQVTSWLELAHVPPSAVGVDPQAAVLSINGGVLVLDLDNLRKNDFVGYAHSMVNKFKVIEQVSWFIVSPTYGAAL